VMWLVPIPGSSLRGRRLPMLPSPLI